MIAGADVLELQPHSLYSVPGELWKDAGGSNDVDLQRLRFWGDRFKEFGTSGLLISQEALDAVAEASEVIDKLTS